MSTYYCTRKHGKLYAYSKKESVKEEEISKGKEVPVEEVYKKELPLEYIPGKDGRDGVDGKDGRDGVDGKDGKDGKDGLPGKDGRDGVDGKDGLPGKDGKDGRDGVDGKDGLPGKDGRDGVDGNPCDHLILEDKYLRLNEEGKIVSNCVFQELKGEGSLLCGYSNKSSGVASFTQGIDNSCSGNLATCLGEGNLSVAATSLTSGINLRNTTKGVTLLGAAGKSLPFSYSLQLCSGLSNTAGVSTMLRTEKRGFFPEGVGVGDSWFSSATGYGEWFELADSQKGKDLSGHFVTIKEGKVEVALTLDEVVGVVSPRLALVGNSAELYWHKASLKDELSSYVTAAGYPDLEQIFQPLGLTLDPLESLDDILSSALEEARKKYPLREEQKKLLGLDEKAGLEDYLKLLEKKIRACPSREVILPNPDYSFSDSVYVPRSKRKEWVKVCLKGRVNVYHSDCKVGERCSVKEGVGFPAKEGYLVLNKSSDKVVTILL